LVFHPAKFIAKFQNYKKNDLVNATEPDDDDYCTLDTGVRVPKQCIKYLSKEEIESLSTPQTTTDVVFYQAKFKTKYNEYKKNQPVNASDPNSDNYCTLDTGELVPEKYITFIFENEDSDDDRVDDAIYYLATITVGSKKMKIGTEVR
jgi:hypothetical protein